MPDIITLGELLIDFTPISLDNRNNIIFERNPGGAPANVAVGLARLKNTTGFIGKTGNDDFGRFLKQVLTDNNVDTTGLILSDEYNTTLAFVHLDKNNDRSFTFYRKNCADIKLEINEINNNLFDHCKIFHFGSLSFTDQPLKNTLIHTLENIKQTKTNIIISYDPNYRPMLWKNKETAKKNIITGLKYADIVKVSEEELELITGSNDLKAGTDYILSFSPAAVFVTLGEKGTFYNVNDKTGLVKSFEVECKDTTGAGDAFMSGILHKINTYGFNNFINLDETQITNDIIFANACGALACTKRGAIPALPYSDEINNFFNNF